MDRLREEGAREEDLVFLADQRDPELRKMSVGKERDLDYDKAVKDKTMRGTRDARMKSKIVTINNNNTVDEDKDDEVIDEDESEDFELPKKRKDNLVTLIIDRKRLAKETAITAKRHKIGITAQRDMLANIINVGGGNIDDFSISNKTVRRAGTAKVKEVAEDINNYYY